MEGKAVASDVPPGSHEETDGLVTDGIEVYVLVGVPGRANPSNQGDDAMILWVVDKIGHQ